MAGDTHGHNVTLLQHIAEFVETSGRVDLVLHVGDVLVIRSPEDLDRAERKRYPADPLIASWPLTCGLPSAEVLDLYRRIDAGGPETLIYAVDGNHCCFEYLRELQDASPDPDLWSLEPSSRWRMMRRGTSLEMGGVRITGCGGITPPAKKKPKERHLIAADLARLRQENLSDVLFTHECPLGAIPNLPTYGDASLKDAGRALRPRWWFFGHHHRHIGPAVIDGLPCTQVVGMGIIGDPGILGLLEIDALGEKFTWVR